MTDQVTGMEESECGGVGRGTQITLAFHHVSSESQEWSLISCHSSSFAGEGNGAPLQSSCLENPMDRGAWWAAVHGVAKSRA